MSEWNISTLKANLQVRINCILELKGFLQLLINASLFDVLIIIHISHRYQKELVLKKLKAKNGIMYFDERSLKEITDGFEGEIFQKSSGNEGAVPAANKKTKRITVNSVTTNGDCEHDGKARLGRLPTSDGLDVDVVVSYHDSALIFMSALQKKILRIPFDNFDSPYFADCLTNLAIQDINLRFGSIIQALAEIFVKQGEKDVLEVCKTIVMNVFALRIQKAIRKRQAILAFSAMKDFKKKSRFTLGSYEIVLDDGRIRKVYVLQKSAFTVMLKITRTFTG